MKHIRKILIVGAFISLMLILAGCQNQGDTVVAIVNGEAIKESEFNAK